MAAALKRGARRREDGWPGRGAGGERVNKKGGIG